MREVSLSNPPPKSSHVQERQTKTRCASDRAKERARARTIFLHNSRTSPSVRPTDRPKQPRTHPSLTLIPPRNNKKKRLFCQRKFQQKRQAFARLTRYQNTKKNVDDHQRNLNKKRGYDTTDAKQIRSTRTSSSFAASSLLTAVAPALRLPPLRASARPRVRPGTIACFPGTPPSPLPAVPSPHSSSWLPVPGQRMVVGFAIDARRGKAG